MLGSSGLQKATEIAILNANYIKERLEGAYLILYKGDNGRAAHELIIDLRPFKEKRNRGSRCGKTINGLWFSRSNSFFPRGRNHDD